MTYSTAASATYYSRQPERPCSICGGSYVPGTYTTHRTTHPANLYSDGGRHKRLGSNGNVRQFLERDVEIAGLVAEGKLTLDEIGARFGITRERVRQLAEREGVSRNNQPVPARPRLGIRETCGRCGERYPTGTAREHAVAADHAYGPSGRLRPSDVAVMRIFYEAGLGYHSIADAFGISFTSVKAQLRRAGVRLHSTGQYPRGGSVAALRVALRAVVRERAA